MQRFKIGRQVLFATMASALYLSPLPADISISQVWAQTSSDSAAGLSVRDPRIAEYSNAVTNAGGAIVFYQGRYFRAKWWANSDDTPGRDVQNAWDTAWEMISAEEAIVAVGGVVIPSEVAVTPAQPETPTQPVVDASTRVIPVQDYAQQAEGIPAYTDSVAFNGGDYVFFNGAYYKAKWWTQGDNPDQTVANAWDKPWEVVSEAEALASVVGGLSTVEVQPVTEDTTPQADTQDSGEGVESKEPVQTTEAETNPQVQYTDEELAQVSEGVHIFSFKQDYQGESIVYHKGQYYRAKWWTTVGQEPGLTTVQAWDTPWEAVSKEEAAYLAKLAPDLTPTAVQDTASDTQQGDNGDAKSGSSEVHAVQRSELKAKEAEITNTPLLIAAKERIVNLPDSRVEQITAGNPNNPENVRRVESIVGSQEFEFLFPWRNAAYTYEGFLRAFGKWPAVCRTYDDGRDSDQICRKLIATMIAHFAQETGGHDVHSDIPEWRQALVHVREMGWNEQMTGGYNGECNPAVWQGKRWPCGTLSGGEFKSYFGRGAKQLSYNYNYGPYGEIATGNVRTFLDNPEMIADTWHNLASALFFFLYPQPPKPSMMDVVDGSWKPGPADLAVNRGNNFGTTVMVINGGVECGGSQEKAQVLNRMAYYKGAAAHLNVPVPADEKLGCANMQEFGSNSSGAVNIFWEQDYSYNVSNPGGKSYACKLVGYQTAYSAFIEGDYEKCVVNFFPDLEIVD